MYFNISSIRLDNAANVNPLKIGIICWPEFQGFHLEEK